MSFLISSRERADLLIRYSKRFPPPKISMMTQKLCSDSNTPSNFNKLECSIDLMISSQFIKQLILFLLFLIPSLEKTLAANLFPSSKRAISQTVAELPFPSTLMGLQKLWKPVSLMTLDRCRIQTAVMLANSIKNSILSLKSLASLKPFSSLSLKL